ncbi:MAG: GNAT family N-acetyltransferase [Myxococcota bacterium]
MTQVQEYGKAQDAEERARFAPIAAVSFGATVEQVQKWLDSNAKNVRVVRRHGAVVGGLILIPMGQFFGGRRVSMTGVAGVAVAPEYRGRGVATAMMRSAVKEMRRSGATLSTLYPATWPLYRRVGYELAGDYFRFSMPARTIGISDRALEVKSIEAGDMKTIKKLYRAHAAYRNGWLDRGEYVWDRVSGPREGRAPQGYAVLGANGIEGYLFYRVKDSEEERYTIAISDMVSSSAQATRRLLSLLADHGSLAKEVVWHGGADDPFLYSLPDRCYEVSQYETWMLRILDVKRALAERGYPQGLDMRLELYVVDDLIRANRGRYVLDISDGVGEVKSGGRGSLRLDIRALAALYAGYHSPQALAELGAIEGSPRTLACAATVFAGSTPSLRDFF